MKKHLLLTFLTSIFAIGAYATHIRAGELSYKYISDNTYEVTFSQYNKTSSQIPRDTLVIDWGDGTTEYIFRTNTEYNVAEDTELMSFVGTHTYTATGVYYIIITDVNRDADIVNIPNSVNISFAVESQINVLPGINNNSTLFLAPPLMRAIAGTTFEGSVSALDPDGDYLTYTMVNCKDQSGEIMGYYIPENFSINYYSGAITWETPQQIGEYNFAVRIDEWRHGVNVGYTIRDFQLLLSASATISAFTGQGNIPKDANNNYAYTIDANQSLAINLSFSAPSGNDIDVKAFGEMFQNGNTATFSKTSIQDGMDFSFNWKPSTTNLRCEPYQLTFRGVYTSSSQFGRDLVILVNVKDQTTTNCITPTVGIQEANMDGANYTIYPNPMADRATIELKNVNSNEKSTFTLYNITGQLVNKTSFTGSTYSFYKNELAKGLYFYQIQTGKASYTNKLAIE